MTQRSIFSGSEPDVIIKAGGSVTVIGFEGDRVSASTPSRWGLQVEKHGVSEIGRARVAVGEKVLFDLHLNKPGRKGGEVFEIKLGGGGEVLVPYGASVKVYAGKDIEVKGIHARLDAYSGGKIILQDVYCLGIASAGWTMDLDCQTLLAASAEFNAGSDIRFHVEDLKSALIKITDTGGHWEARIGDGEKSVNLKSGGDVTLVTDQEVQALPPNYILGRIEKPGAA